MNMQENSSRGPQAATEATKFPGYEKAFDSLESPIDEVMGFAKTQLWLTIDIFEANGGAAPLHEEHRYILSFISHQLEKSAKRLEEQWIALHNAGTALAYEAMR